MLLSVYAEHPEPRKIRRAVEALRAGEVIAYPTDTVYALGCDLNDKHAIERLYQMKGMPRTQPLALICHDLADIARYANVDTQSYRTLKRLLPGAYTFILEATREVPKMLVSKTRTVGIRVPAHEVPLALARELGRPLLSTSAARKGEPVLTDAHAIQATFKNLAIVIDTGLGGDVPSTVVDLTLGVVVREGAGPVEDLF